MSGDPETVFVMMARDNGDGTITMKTWKLRPLHALGLESMLGEPSAVQLQTAETRAKILPLMDEVVTIYRAPDGQGEEDR